VSWYDFHGVSLPDTGLMWVRGNLLTAIDLADNYWQPDVIRFPVYPGKVEKFVPPLPVDDMFINEILVPAIEYAHGKGIRAIVDYHEVDYIRRKEERAKQFWELMIPALEPLDVMLELFNEPTEQTWAEYRPSMQRLVSFVRERTDKPLLIGTPRYCKLLHPAVDFPIEGTDLSYTAHLYPEYVPAIAREEFDLPEKEYSEFDSIDMCRQKFPVVLTEVGWDSDVITDSFRTRIEQLMSEVSWIAWVLHDEWWPALVDYCESLTEFGKDIQRLGLNTH
jgi:hypothetical protein